jgi:hypothetical protein
MRISVEYGQGRVELDLAEEIVLGVWSGPAGLPDSALKPLVLETLDHPLGYPPLRQAVVPGDRVVMPVDPATPALGPMVHAVCEVLQSAGVEREGISVLALGPKPESINGSLPMGLAWHVHDPDDESARAYLASTREGRRIYLNREVVDADFVLPIGRIGLDSSMGLRGPWSVVFPGLSDSDTRRSVQSRAASRGASEASPETPALAESAGVSWLLGSQLQMGVVEGSSGVAGLVAGAEADVQSAGLRVLEEAWTYRVEERAALVVAGIGRPDHPGSLDDLAEAASTATRLVRRGGKIVLLSEVEGVLGPALGRIASANDPTRGPSLLKGTENEIDYPAALRLAEALAWADVYLFSRLDESSVEDLGMIALGRPSEAARLAQASDSCYIVSRAEATRALVDEDEL